jgi:hypothetical protein
MTEDDLERIDGRIAWIVSDDEVRSIVADLIAEVRRSRAAKRLADAFAAWAEHADERTTVDGDLLAKAAAYRNR